MVAEKQDFSSMPKCPSELFTERVIQNGFSQVGGSLPFYHSWVRGLWGQLFFMPSWKMKTMIVSYVVHAAENKGQNGPNFYKDKVKIGYLGLTLGRLVCSKAKVNLTVCNM